MTDNEIIKALKECEECHFYNECEKSTRLALDLINRQKAEIERLRADLDCYEETSGNKQAKAEAITEFAERLKEGHSQCDGEEDVVWLIDQIVKEMKGELYV